MLTCVYLSACWCSYLMKSCAPHTADITALVYCALDQTIVSVSWDRSLVVHDEKPNTEDCPALRTVTNAHDADINCLAYSRELSLLGTGAADGTLRVWDYQSVKLVGVCEGHEVRWKPATASSCCFDARLTRRWWLVWCCLVLVNVCVVLMGGYAGRDYIRQILRGAAIVGC